MYEGINESRELEDKEKFSKELIKEVDKQLKLGYNPFEAEHLNQQIKQEVKAEILLSENPKSPLITEALRLFMTSRHERVVWIKTRSMHKRDFVESGYSDAEIMNLTDHRDTASFDTYKRVG